MKTHSFVFPGDIDPEIASIGSSPIPYMRTSEFSGINLESISILKDLFHCKDGEVLIYTGSGTGAMAAVVENYVVTKKKAIVIDGGSFGHRWWDLCSYYAVPAVHFEVPFARDIDYALLEETIKVERPDVLLCQHHETSSGQLFDLPAISRICRRYGVSLVVDVVSSFLAEEFDMDALGVDICLTSTQKGLNVPPGLSIVCIGGRLAAYPFARNGYYWDFRTNIDNLRRGQTPFSPATTIYLQLNARLRRLREEGGEAANIARVRHRASVFRAEVAKYGWEMPAQVPSCSITSIQTADTPERKVFRGLIEKYKTFIMPGNVPGLYRISHLGLQTDGELKLLAARIRELEA